MIISEEVRVPLLLTEKLLGCWRIYITFLFRCVLCTADIDLHSSAEIEDIAARFGVGTPTLQHIIDGLKQPTDHDIRVSKYTL